MSITLASRLESYARTLARIEAGNHPDQAKTLAAWRSRAKVTHDALQEVRRKMEGDIAELHDTFAIKVANPKIEELRKEFGELTEIAKKRVAADLAKTIANKREAFSKANAAPTDAEIRLLSALSMRSSISQGEVAEAAGQLRSLQALRVLHDLAEKHGVHAPQPLTPEDFEETIRNIETECGRYIDGISAAEPSYRASLFWSGHPCPESTMFDRLDGRFSTPQAFEQAPVAGANATKVYCRGGEDLSTVAMQFGIRSYQIRAANPDVDFSVPITAGQQLIIPATKMTSSTLPGAVGFEQAIPAHYDPDPNQSDGAATVE